MSATVDEEHSVVCARATEERNGAVGGATVQRLVRSFPFHELVTGVYAVLDQLGIDGLGPVTVTHRRVRTAAADCFARASGESSAEWCFGSDGTLLALTLSAEGRAPTSVEVRHISSDVRWIPFEPLSPLVPAFLTSRPRPPQRSEPEAFPRGVPRSPAGLVTNLPT